MSDTNERTQIWGYLFLIFLIAGFSYAMCILGERTGVLSGAGGENIIMIIDTFGTGFSLMYTVYIPLKNYRKIIGVNDIIVALAFCIALFSVTTICGTRIDYPLLIIIPAIPLMILG